MSPSTGQHNSCRRLQHHKSKVSTSREQLAHLQIIVIINHADFTPFKRVLGELCVQAALAPGARGPGLCVLRFDAAEPHTMGQNQRERPMNAVHGCTAHHLSSSAAAAQLFWTFQSCCKMWIMKQNVLTLNYDWMRSSQSYCKMPVRTCACIFYINAQSWWHHK